MSSGCVCNKPVKKRGRTKNFMTAAQLWCGSIYHSILLTCETPFSKQSQDQSSGRTWNLYLPQTCQRFMKKIQWQSCLFSCLLRSDHRVIWNRYTNCWKNIHPHWYGSDFYWYINCWKTSIRIVNVIVNVIIIVTLLFCYLCYL